MQSTPVLKLNKSDLNIVSSSFDRQENLSLIALSLSSNSIIIFLEAKESEQFITQRKWLPGETIFDLKIKRNNELIITTNHGIYIIALSLLLSSKNDQMFHDKINKYLKGNSNSGGRASFYALSPQNFLEDVVLYPKFYRYFSIQKKEPLIDVALKNFKTQQTFLIQEIQMNYLILTSNEFVIIFCLERKIFLRLIQMKSPIAHCSICVSARAYMLIQDINKKYWSLTFLDLAENALIDSWKLENYLKREPKLPNNSSMYVVAKQSESKVILFYDPDRNLVSVHGQKNPRECLSTIPIIGSPAKIINIFNFDKMLLFFFEDGKLSALIAREKDAIYDFNCPLFETNIFSDPQILEKVSVFEQNITEEYTVYIAETKKGIFKTTVSPKLVVEEMENRILKSYLVNEKMYLNYVDALGFLYYGEKYKSKLKLFLTRLLRENQQSKYLIFKIIINPTGRLEKYCSAINEIGQADHDEFLKVSQTLLKNLMPKLNIEQFQDILKAVLSLLLSRPFADEKAFSTLALINFADSFENKINDLNLNLSLKNIEKSSITIRKLILSNAFVSFYLQNNINDMLSINTMKLTTIYNLSKNLIQLLKPSKHDLQILVFEFLASILQENELSHFSNLECLKKTCELYLNISKEQRALVTELIEPIIVEAFKYLDVCLFSDSVLHLMVYGLVGESHYKKIKEVLQLLLIDAPLQETYCSITPNESICNIYKEIMRNCKEINLNTGDIKCNEMSNFCFYFLAEHQANLIN